jgi:hypothetical protein
MGRLQVTLNDVPRIRGGITRRACCASWVHRSPRTIPRRVRNRAVNAEGLSEPIDPDQKQEQERQDHRGFRDLGSPGIVCKTPPDYGPRFLHSYFAPNILQFKMPYNKVVNANATPYGIFSDCGLSSETSAPGIRKVNIDPSMRQMLRSVSINLRL